MLDLLRRAVRSWIAKILLGLLVISFAVWGIGDIATGSSRNVAQVGGQSVAADVYATVLRREQQRYNLDPTQIRPAGLDRWVLARLIREAALDDAAARLGVSAPDDAIARQVRRDPAFQIAGSFDPAQYASAVRRNYPSIGHYEEMVRRALASSQIAALAQVGVRAPQGAAEALIGWREERRGFDVLTLSPLPDDPAIAEPTDEDLQAWLDANPGAFEAPERRDVTFLHIDVAAL
ncbi:MAG: SurA N-terminal domain-containing protein, partial [Rubrimonas sp.]